MSDPSPRQSPLPAWAKSLDDESFSWSAAVGGRRGVVESLLPGLVFVIAFITTHNLWWTCGAAIVAALIACLIRVIQRQPLTQALSGLGGVAVGVIWATASGRGENYFTWGLITAAVFLVGIVASIVVKRSVVALGVSMVWQMSDGWHDDPQWRPLVIRCRRLTWMWAGLFAIRLGVQLPLWQAGMIAELGVAKLILGLPLFALACWATWVGLRPFADASRAVKDC
ncbi:DUF3159 domain-containing protein [Actinomyces mediterranea]|uniref:DUF3159 domain-containing protein n=1 Tax=Actinomyces mediterranea TaxID=1871028 RepID=UPI00097041E6|nr:DUF3159 domain-containing protein [Actinomyces mediterranea]